MDKHSNKILGTNIYLNKWWFWSQKAKLDDDNEGDGELR